MRLRSAAWIVFAALEACSLRDFAGFSDGDPTADGGSPDGANTSDAGGSDGDSSVSPANDASADALVEAAPTFCETNGDAAFFCEDFDKPGALNHFDVLKTIRGSLVVENATMLVDAPASAQDAYVSGTKAAKTAGAHARVAFSVQPEILNTLTANACQLAKVYFFASGKPPYEVGVGVKGAGSSLVYAYEYIEGVGYSEFGPLPALAAGKMTRFVLDVRIAPLDAIGPTINLDRDGVRVVTDGALSPPASSGAIELYIGLPYLPPDHGPWRFRFDDIVMGLPP